MEAATPETSTPAYTLRGENLEWRDMNFSPSNWDYDTSDCSSATTSSHHRHPYASGEWKWAGNPALIHSFPIPPTTSGYGEADIQGARHAEGSSLYGYAPNFANASTASLLRSPRPLPTPPMHVSPYPPSKLSPLIQRQTSTLAVPTTELPPSSTFAPGSPPPQPPKKHEKTKKNKTSKSKIPTKKRVDNTGRVKPTLELGLDDMDMSPFSESFSGLFDAHEAYTPDEGDVSQRAEQESSLLLNQRSFVIERYPDPKVVDPSWKDEDIDEIVIITPKQGIKKRVSTLSNLNGKLPIIPEYAPGVSHAKFRSYDESIKLADFEFLPTPPISKSRHPRPPVTSSLAPAPSPTIPNTTRSSLHGSTKHVCAYRKPNGVLQMDSLYTVKRRTGISSISANFAWRELDVMGVISAGRGGTGASESCRGKDREEIPFVEKMYGTFVDAENIYLVLGHHEKGDLAGLVATHGPLGVELVKIYAGELLLAIQYIHGEGITHTAISPSNIHIDATNHVVLTSFEVACVKGEKPVNIEYERNSERDYLAPEMLLGWAFDGGVDIWGFGMVLGWMAGGKHVFLGGVDSDSLREAEHESKILYGPVLLDGVGESHGSVTDLITKCLERNPAVRIKSNDIIQHEYLSSVDWKKLSGKHIPVPVLKQSLNEENVSRPETRKPKIKKSVDIDITPLTEAPPKSNSATLTVREGPSVLQPVCCSRTPAVATETSHIAATNLIIEELRFTPPPPPTASSAGQLSNISVPPSYTLDVVGPGIARDSYLKEIEMNTKELELTPQERMALFWEKIDSEEVMAQMHQQAKAPESPTRPRKLRKKKSTIRTLGHRISSISLGREHPSHPNKLRKKDPRRGSTTSLLPHTHVQIVQPEMAAENGCNSTPPAVKSDAFTPKKIHDLPKGVEQIGSGIGFTYSLPSASKSMASICTDKSAPGWKRHMRILPNGIGRGLRGVRHRLSMGKMNLTSNTGIQAKRRDGLECGRNQGLGDHHGLGLALDDFGQGYQCDSSPEVGHEPLTPDTLVFEDEHLHHLGSEAARLESVAKMLPEHASMGNRLDDPIEEDLRHMSTLRLVQSPRSGA